MTTIAKLSAEIRDSRGKGPARRMRAEGRVPGVVYGKDEETLTLSVDAGEAEHLFQAISVENTIVHLDLDGADGPVQTLVREIQVHPLRPGLLHIDFYRIRAGEKVEVEIPVNLNGVPDGVKNSGGILQQVIHELPVRVLPSEIPPSVEVDVTALDMGDAVHVAELELADEVEVLLDPERTVASVVAPKALIVEEEEEEEAEVELIGEEGEEIEGELPEGETPEREGEAAGEEESEG